ALALFARRSVLSKRGVRIATLDAPYTRDEFLSVLAKLKAADPSRYPLDINTIMTGEWLSYGFGPWLQSAGADLIDRSGFAQAEGILNGPEAVAVARWYQRLFEQAYAPRRAVDDLAFPQGQADIHYTGSWVAIRYERKLGDDLVIMPPIDFGQGPKIGSGSWQWGISRTCPHPEGAAAFIEFLLMPSQIASMSEAAGFVPVSDASAALTTRYRPGGRWRIFYEFAKRFAVPRPQTPGYPKISSAFEKAMLDIRDGQAVREALDAAVDSIEYDIERNGGYGLHGEQRR
ncbi:MAG: extracellular solute-binding protein, partial [Myxococcota bacterium]